MVTYPVPCNDDATKAVELVSSVIAEAIVEGRNRFVASRAPVAETVAKPEAEEAA
jgi:ribosomal protein S2